MKFIFVRHGKTHFNEINLTQGWCDSPLSKLGVKQVENMSLQLKDYSKQGLYITTWKSGRNIRDYTSRS